MNKLLLALALVLSAASLFPTAPSVPAHNERLAGALAELGDDEEEDDEDDEEDRA